MGKTIRKNRGGHDPRNEWVDGYDPHRDGDSVGLNLPKYLREHLVTGPGGACCPCCFDAPGKKRKARIRAAKRRQKQNIRREIEEALEDVSH